MRRVFLIIVLLFFPFFIFGNIVIPEETPTSVRKALVDNLDGRCENAELKECEINGEEVYLKIEVDGEEYETTFLLSKINKEIENMFFYEKSLYDESPILEYVYSSSYSSILSNKYRKGTLLECRDKNGKIRGLFKISGNYDEYSEFRAEFLRHPLPGMKIKKVNSLFYDFSFFTYFKKDFSFSFSLFDSSLLYPFYPVVGVEASFSLSSFSSVFFSLGIGSKLSFASIFPNISFIKDLSLSAECNLLLGYTYNKGFDLSSSYDIKLLYNPSSYINIFVGLKRSLKGFGLTAGLGGRF